MRSSILFLARPCRHCPETGEEIKSISKDYVVRRILELPIGDKVQILAPIEIRKNDKFEDILSRLRKQGFLRIRLNNEFYDLDESAENLAFDRKRKNDLLLVINRFDNRVDNTRNVRSEIA